MTTITSLQILLNVADTEIVDRMSELKRLESAICDIAIEANYICHDIENMPAYVLLSNFNESVKYINKLAEKYFKMPLFNDTYVISVFEVLKQHGIEYDVYPVDVDRLIYMIKHA